MSKRLQVVLEDDEYGEIQAAAEHQRLTVSAWVRRVLREARAEGGLVREAGPSYGEKGVTLRIPDFPASLHGRLVARARRERRSPAAEAAWLLERALAEGEGQGKGAPSLDAGRKLASVRAAQRYEYPTADIGQMLREIEAGYDAGRGE